MLVLSRKRHEKITLTVPASAQPMTIELIIVQIGPTTVRLGWEAPREVDIVRDDAGQPLHSRHSPLTTDLTPESSVPC